MALADAGNRVEFDTLGRPSSASEEFIHIARPFLGDEEIEAVATVMRSGELVQGRWVAEFEREFATFCGAAHAIATSSGTTALHVALLAHGIGQGDEVITTAFTFIASTNAILYVGARPVFADIKADSFNIDPEQVEHLITPKTKAILAVDLYGNPADLIRLQEICDRHKLALIDDASQAHGAAIRGRRTGTFGTGCFSFYPSKNMTTAEGGMITTDRDDIASVARSLRQHGAERTYFHELLGFNFRMTNIQAAIGIQQLKRLPEFNERRIANAGYLNQHMPGIPTPITQPDYTHVFHQYTVRVPGDRDRLASELKKNGIESRVYYPLPVHRQPAYAGLGFDDVHLPETDRAAREVLSLPVHPAVTQADLQRIVRAVMELWS
jgi:perosamine synthetase